MKRIIILTVVWGTLLAAPSFAQDHTDVVASAKAALVATGADLAGDCGAFRITKVVAWQLRGEGAGLLAKPGGANCDGYAAAIIAYPDGRIFDILVDAGGANGPAWQGDRIDPNRYRPAIAPNPQPPIQTPQPAPLPSTPTCDVSGLTQQLDALTVKVDATAAEQHQFIEDARDRYRKVATFVAKYGTVIMGAILAGRISK